MPEKGGLLSASIPAVQPIIAAAASLEQSGVGDNDREVMTISVPIVKIGACFVDVEALAKNVYLVSVSLDASQVRAHCFTIDP
jgi:hypothetical protein